MIDFNKLFNKSISEPCILNQDVHQLVIDILKRTFTFLFKIPDIDLLFNYQKKLSYTGSFYNTLSLEYEFNYGSATVRNSENGMILYFSFRGQDVKNLNIPLDVAFLSVYFDNFFSYQYSHFKRNFYLLNSNNICAEIIIELRHFSNHTESSLSGCVLALGSRFKPLIIPNDVANNFSFFDEMFFKTLDVFLTYSSRHSLTFNEIFPEYVPYLESISDFDYLVDFISLFNKQYTDSFDILKQKLMLCHIDVY